MFPQFDLMYERLKTTVSIHENGSYETVQEPVVNTSQQNIVGNQVAGGTVMIGSMVWISKRADVPMKTKVTTLGKEYTVETSGKDVVAGFTYYQLKEVETKHIKESSGFDD